MISFIYFDLGGVVIHDFNGTNKWEELKKSFGISSEKSEAFDEWFNLVEPEVNKGRDLESLLPEMKDKFNVKVPENYSFLIDGFVSHFETNTTIWPLITEAQKNYRIGLLTNMYPGMFNAITKQGIMPHEEWHVIVDSSLVGTCKPERKIYEIAEEQAGARGSEIFFIDNSIKNIEGAKKLGWQTMLYNPSATFRSNEELTRMLEDLA